MKNQGNKSQSHPLIYFEYQTYASLFSLFSSQVTIICYLYFSYCKKYLLDLDIDKGKLKILLWFFQVGFRVIFSLPYYYDTTWMHNKVNASVVFSLGHKFTNIFRLHTYCKTISTSTSYKTKQNTTTTTKTTFFPAVFPISCEVTPTRKLVFPIILTPHECAIKVLQLRFNPWTKPTPLSKVNY